MNPHFAKPSTINNSARCNHRFPNGMRCRLFAFGSLPFCPKHTEPAAMPPPDPAEIASTLTANLDDFTSAAQINDFLSRLLLLLAQDKISTRRAAVLAYITNQLLRTLPPSPRKKIPSPPRSSSTCPVPTATAPIATTKPQTKIRTPPPRQRRKRSPHETQSAGMAAAHSPLARNS
jgi:hypothetical protein